MDFDSLQIIACQTYHRTLTPRINSVYLSESLKRSKILKSFQKVQMLKMFKQERINNVDRSKYSTSFYIISIDWPDRAHCSKNYSSNKKVTQWIIKCLST